jgi:rSAM/selenodomain-associated transferase 2
MLSIIIPTLNEQDTISSVIDHIQSVISKTEYEIIVVDAGSHDATCRIAESIADQLILSPAGRGLQMNRGAKMSNGDILLFLHADTILPVNFDQHIIHCLKDGKKWGRFKVKLSGQLFIFRFIEFMMNIRSRLTSVCTGDQAIFVTRDLFETSGGFQNISLMEDIEISKRLRGHGRPAIINQPVITSSRRWEENGILRTILLMWWLRFLYFIGVSPDTLCRKY